MSTLRRALAVFCLLPLLWALAACPGPSTNTYTNNAATPNANITAQPNANHTPLSNVNNANQVNANIEQSNANDMNAKQWCKYEVRSSGCEELRRTIVCLRCVAGQRCPDRRNTTIKVKFKEAVCTIDISNTLSRNCETCTDGKIVVENK